MAHGIGHAGRRRLCRRRAGGLWLDVGGRRCLAFVSCPGICGVDLSVVFRIKAPVGHPELPSDHGLFKSIETTEIRLRVDLREQELVQLAEESKPGQSHDVSVE